MDEKEGKHPDFVPPKPVSLSKDYDDPTSVLGRNFANVDHAPAFAILGTKLGEMLTRIGRGTAAPDAAGGSELRHAPASSWPACWTHGGRSTRRICRGMNAELAKRRLPPLARRGGRARDRMPLTRRYVLGGAGSVHGVHRDRSRTTALSAVAKPPPRLAPAALVQHVVVIFQENVSFDHYFATYPHAANLPGERVVHAAAGDAGGGGSLG